MNRKTKRGIVSSTMLSVAIVLSGATAAWAGQATGTTTLPAGTYMAGAQIDVDVSVVSETPVVAYEYSIRNECKFPGSKGGRADSTQTDPIVNWIYSSASSTIPHAIMPIYLTYVPPNSRCNVFLMKNNVIVKGSTTGFIVS